MNTITRPRPALVPGQKPGDNFAAVELLGAVGSLELTVERVEVHATRSLAVAAAVRIADLWGVRGNDARALIRDRVEEEGRFDVELARGRFSVQVVRVAHLARTVTDTESPQRRKGGVS